MRPHKSLPTRAAWAIAAALVLSLALTHLHPFGNADLFAAPRSQPPQLPASIPTDARALLAAHCADCHSSTARAPFYGHFAPVSWLLEHDIVEAREHLNLSNWDQYSNDQQQFLLAEIAQQARGGHMPPPQYLLIHRHARLTSLDVATLTAWTHSASLTIDSPDSVNAQPMPASPQNAVILSEAHRAESKDPDGAEPASGARTVPTSAAQGAPPKLSLGGNDAQLLPPDATRGAAHPAGIAAQGDDLFNRRCTGCHSLTQNREGPHLAGVYGRPAASIAGFPYSAALSTAAESAHLTWNDQTLDQWLTDPSAFIPGVNMDFRVPRPQERTDIIAFLKSSSGK